MKPTYLLLGVMLISCTIAIPWESSNSLFTIGPGTIIEKGLDFFLYAKTLVMEVTLDAIFLTEDNILRLHEDLVLFQNNLESVGRKHFTLNHTGPTLPIYDMAEVLFKEVNDKLVDTRIKVNELFKWSIPHDEVEWRNSFLFAALSGLGIFGSLVGMGLGIANLVKLRFQKEKLEKLEHEQDVIVSQLNKQLHTINKIVDELNDATSFLQDLGNTQLLVTTLSYYYMKISQTYDRIISFEEKTKDYIEAITLAIKGVLSPHLLPIKDLMQIVYNARDRMGWKPMVEPHRLELYYSLIAVKVENGKILVSIPFHPSDPFESYVLQPFPTRFGVLTVPKVSNYRALVLLSRSANIYTVVYDDDKDKLNCVLSLNSKVCSVDSFVFQDITGHSCILQLVLNGTFTWKEDRCEDGFRDFEKDTYSYRLLNGSALIYEREDFKMSCPRGVVPKSNVALLVDGCNTTSARFKRYGVATITRGSSYFLNETWRFDSVVMEMPVFDGGLHNVPSEGEPLLTFHESVGLRVDYVMLMTGIFALVAALGGALCLLHLHGKFRTRRKVSEGTEVKSDSADQVGVSISRPLIQFV